MEDDINVDSTPSLNYIVPSLSIIIIIEKQIACPTFYVQIHFASADHWNHINLESKRCCFPASQPFGQSVSQQASQHKKPTQQRK